MNERFQKIILAATSAQKLFVLDKIQDLWSGYGVIVRYGLKGSTWPSVVVKHVTLPKTSAHPRGWNTDLSHQRKLKSYHVEIAWYQRWSLLCDAACRVPRCYANEIGDDEMLIVLEDLNGVGFSGRRCSVTLEEMKMCLSWLANFHATYMGQTPDQLWPVGTYWHLATRPDELQTLDDHDLKQAAHIIDQKLNDVTFKSFVHGDAKLANFCFLADGSAVAAVDFQYVGGGCGMKDVAYFIGSCLEEDDCQLLEKELLDVYFSELNSALSKKSINVNAQAVEAEWRSLYPVAWTDFHRFIKGWSPGHWKINSYSERLARQTLEEL